VSILEPWAPEPSLPLLVWVPAQPAAPAAGEPGEPRVRIELRTSGGDAAAVVFSTRARLVAALGPAQPWMVMDAGHLRALLAAAEVRQVLLDPDLTACPGRWETDDLRRLTA